jgi:hypothetical protein
LPTKKEYRFHELALGIDFKHYIINLRQRPSGLL